MSLDLDAVKARVEAAETTPGHPAGALMDAWVRSARDVPALVAEVERLRSLRMCKACRQGNRDLLHPPPEEP